ncbi:hypothetical protein IFR04_009597, partial [Cadophora malorum]
MASTFSEPQPTAQHSASASLTTFPLFPLLASELRILILTHASSPNLHPIIHQIDTRRSTFISNQAPHPLLHTSRLTRSTYLLTTGAVYAFGTYVSFTHDIFYFPHFARVDNLDKLRAFLKCEETRGIRKLAVKRELFDRAWGEFFGSSSRTTSTALGNGMGEGGGRGGGLEGMEELLIVWRDWRVVREAWREKEG